MPPDTWSIGQLARIARVTVRTLHHYDAVGLLSPMRRTDAGYRVYGPAELERLHLIRLYRDAGVPLDHIGPLLDDPDFDRLTALKGHLARLDEEIARHQRLRASLSKLIDQETPMSTQNTQPTQLFDGFDPEAFHDEARERWGTSRAWKVSQRRTKNRTPEEWARYKQAADQVEQALADALQDGIPADAPRAMDLAEQHRQLITDWFYPCGYDTHVGLGEMYVADERFTAHYDQRQPGLAKYLSEAIFANAATRA